MRAVWARACSEVRAGWRRQVGIVVLTALPSGAVMALAAGARRTKTAYPRFLEHHEAYDALVVNYPADETAIFDFDELSRLPMVAESARGPMEYLPVGTGVAAVASIGGEVTVGLQGFGAPQQLRVVGQVVLPALSPEGQLGEGALLSGEAGGALAGAQADDDEGPMVLFVRFAEGADPEQVTGQLGEAMGRQLAYLERGRPTDVVNFGRVEAMPFVLGAILAALAAATLPTPSPAPSAGAGGSWRSSRP